MEGIYLTDILEVKKLLIESLRRAAMDAQAAGKLPQVPLPEITVEHPQNPGHGDYASSLPLKLARSAGQPPMNIARSIGEFLKPGQFVSGSSVAAPGFINFTLDSAWLAQQVSFILSSGKDYGNIRMGQGGRIQIEFVSVNPTGPLHVGHGRGAVLGSTLANALCAAGFNVEKEYYINDAGNQIDAFARSLFVRYQQLFGLEAELPCEGYLGGYMVDLAQKIKDEQGPRFIQLPEDEAISKIGQAGVAKMLESIGRDLEKLGVFFDVWFSEKSLYDNGQYKRVISLLRQGNYLAEKEGATWFVSTALGEDKDNVVIRSDGTATYFGTDIAYHYNKFIERGFERVVNIWGADHQGHVSRMKAVVSALGIDPERLEIIISQMVTLRRGEELVKLSKRSGDIVTLREVIDEAGKDACRFFFLSRSADSQMDFDLELAKKESQENPVYYIQYAHARIASILKVSAERGIKFDDGDVSMLTSEPELALIRHMLLLPEIVEVVAGSMKPHHLAYYAQELATSFHSFYKLCRVVSDDKEITKARLKLVQAAKATLSNTLGLMGMSAPDTM